MDHIGCGGSLKITLALTAARQHGGGDVQPAQFQGPLYYPQYWHWLAMLWVRCDALSSLTAAHLGGSA